MGTDMKRLQLQLVLNVLLVCTFILGFWIVKHRTNFSPTALSNSSFRFTQSAWQFSYQHGKTPTHVKRIKTILLWTDFFGRPKWYHPFPKGQKHVEINCTHSKHKCVLSYDRRNPEYFDAIVFHSRDVKANSPIPDQKKRRAEQVYIMHLWESPVHNGGSYPGATFYNWSSTYSPDSDITSRHRIGGKLTIRKEHVFESLPQLKKKRPAGTASVLWIVTSCKSTGRRDLYFDVFKKYIAVDVYGGCGKKCPQQTTGNDQNCYELLSKTGYYKFYLAWENSFCKDYISFKSFRALNSSLVPVVMGGLTADDYKYLLPPNSYIDVRNFTSPKALADYLIYLDKNDEEYKAYHAWKKDYWVVAVFEPLFCKYCVALNNQTMMSQQRNVDWAAHWNAKKCDTNLVKKLLAQSKPP